MRNTGGRAQGGRAFGASRPDLKFSEGLMIGDKWLKWVVGIA
jgi:hypothetical protein